MKAGVVGWRFQNFLLSVGKWQKRRVEFSSPFFLPSFSLAGNAIDLSSVFLGRTKCCCSPGSDQSSQSSNLAWKTLLTCRGFFCIMLSVVRVKTANLHSSSPAWAKDPVECPVKRGRAMKKPTRQTGKNVALKIFISLYCMSSPSPEPYYCLCLPVYCLLSDWCYCFWCDKVEGHSLSDEEERKVHFRRTSGQRHMFHLYVTNPVFHARDKTKKRAFLLVTHLRYMAYAFLNTVFSGSFPPSGRVIEVASTLLDRGQCPLKKSQGRTCVECTGRSRGSAGARRGIMRDVC